MKNMSQNIANLSNTSLKRLRDLPPSGEGSHSHTAWAEWFELDPEDPNMARDAEATSDTIWSADPLFEEGGVVSFLVDQNLLSPRTITWEDGCEDTYVMCVYGPDGDQPGDCHTRIGVDADRLFWFDEGDDVVRVQTFGPFPTREEAAVASEEFAANVGEGIGDETAEEMMKRMLTDAAGEASDDGKYCVWWETVGDVSDVVDRYEYGEQAQAACEMANKSLHKHNPGQLLCGYEVRYLDDDGQWVRSDADAD